MEQPPRERHTLRNALIVGGGLTVAGGGLLLQRHKLIQQQEKILQHAANRDVREAVRAAAKATKEAAKKPKNIEDPHRRFLKNLINRDRGKIDPKFPQPLIITPGSKASEQKANPVFEQHIDEIMKDIHAPVAGSNVMTAKEITTEKNKRVMKHVAGMRKDYTHKLDVMNAWENFGESKYANRVLDKHGETGFLKGELRGHPETPHPLIEKYFPTHGYSEEYGKIVDLNKPPIFKGKPPLFGEEKKYTRPKSKPVKIEKGGINEGLQRLVRLIELDVTLKEGRDPAGKFSSGGTQMADAPSMQYAYHMPMVTPGSNGAPRGRGRPPGSQNQKTLIAQQAQQVQNEAIAQQPEAKQSHLLRNVAIGAGGLAVAGALAAPTIYKSLSKAGEQQAAVGDALGKVTAGKFDPFLSKLLTEHPTLEEGLAATHKKVLAHNVKAAEKGLNPITMDDWMGDPDHYENFFKKKPAPDVNALVSAKTVKSDIAVAKSEATVANKNTDIEKLNRELDDTKGKLNEANQNAAAHPGEKKELEKKIKDLTEQLRGSFTPPTKEERVRAALGHLKTLKGFPLHTEEELELQKHHFVTGRTDSLDSPLPTKEELTGHELFITGQTDSMGNPLPGKKGPPNFDQPEQIDLLKQGNLGEMTVGGGGGAFDPLGNVRQAAIERFKAQNMGNRDIGLIARSVNMRKEDVAEAEGIMQFHGATTRFGPSKEVTYQRESAEHPSVGVAGSKFNPPMTEKGNDLILRMNEDQTLRHKLQARMKEVRTEEHERFAAALPKGTKFSEKEHGEERDRWVSEARTRAIRGLLAQEVSEGRLPSSVIGQLPEDLKPTIHDIVNRPVGAFQRTKPVETGRAIEVKGDPAFSWTLQGQRIPRDEELARRFLRRIELMRQATDLVEFSSFVKDVEVRKLPGHVQKEIARFITVKPGTKVAHYMMGADELMAKADPHNMAAARLKIEKEMSQKAARAEVHARRDHKMVLIMNDKMVDGHHYTGKADYGKYTSSLHVLDLSPSRFQMSAMQPNMIELGLNPDDEEQKTRWGSIAKDAAIGGVASAVGTAGLLAGTGLLLKRKAPDLSKMLATAAGQHVKVFNPVRTAGYMKSLPEASRIFGKQLRAVSSAEDIAAKGVIPTADRLTQAFKESNLGLQDAKDIAAFKNKYGRTPGETMEKSVGLLSGVAATGVGAAGGAIFSPAWKKKKEEEDQLAALHPGMIELGRLKLKTGQVARWGRHLPENLPYGVDEANRKSIYQIVDPATKASMTLTHEPLSKKTDIGNLFVPKKYRPGTPGQMAGGRALANMTKTVFPHLDKNKVTATTTAGAYKGATANERSEETLKLVQGYQKRGFKIDPNAGWATPYSVGMTRPPGAKPVAPMTAKGLSNYLNKVKTRSQLDALHDAGEAIKNLGPVTGATAAVGATAVAAHRDPDEHPSSKVARKILPFTAAGAGLTAGLTASRIKTGGENISHGATTVRDLLRIGAAKSLGNSKSRIIKPLYQ